MDPNRDEFYSGIVNGFLGACGRLLRPGQADAALWLLVDHILLLFQSSVYVNIFRRDGDQWMPIFSSLPPQDRLFLGLPDAEAERIEPGSAFHVVSDTGNVGVTVRHLPMPESHAEKDAAVLQSSGFGDAQTTENIQRLVDRFASDEDIDLRHFSWTRYLARLTARHDNNSISLPARADVLKLQSAVGSVLDSVGRSRLTQSPSGKGINLFAVVRYPSAARIIDPPRALVDPARTERRSQVEYNYSLKLLLSPGQCQWLALNHVDPDQLSEALPNGARSIADTPIGQGNVDFSLPNERKEDFPGSRQYYPRRRGAGAKRIVAEDVLYRLAFDGQTSTGDETLFYVPIHLNGVPWLALFTFNQGPRSPESMMRNYFLYRDLIPLLSESMSVACQNAFAESLAESATNAFEEARGRVDFIDVVNEAWRSTAGLYPYGVPSLTRDGPPADKLDLDIPYSLFLRCPGPEAVLPYRTLDHARVRATISHALQRAALRLRSVYHHLYKDALFVFGHQAGKLFQESGLAGYVPADNPSALRMKNRLFLAWGMAEAIRALKYEQAGLPKDWFDIEEDGTVNSSLAEAADSALLVSQFYVAGAAASLDPRLPIRLRAPGQVLDITIAQTAAWLHQDFESLPPLRYSREGQLGTLALTFGLAELIRNAFHHILTNSAELLAALADREIEAPVLDLSISTQADTLVITVRNRKWGSDKLRVDTLHRIQDIERAVFVFDGKTFVETGTPESEPGADEIQWVSATWEFRYGQIVEMIDAWKTADAS